MKIARLLFVSIFVSHLSFGQSWSDTLSLIDQTLRQYLPDNPGYQLSIARNGQIILSAARGTADLERKVALTPNSIFEAGSVSKQFTAASILLLEQQGKLSVDDNVQKYIPEFPDYGAPIKISHLLHHTSGLIDWGEIATLNGWPRTRKFYSNEDVLEIILRQRHLNNQPGDEFLYSNSNYNLLATIVQRVSGLTLAEFTRKNIFEPAGMTHTRWRDDPNRIVPNRAIAYLKKGDAYETDMPNEYVYGHGALLTTTEDLLKWCDFYQQGRFGAPSLISKQIHTEPLNNGVRNSYAAGLFIRKVMGWDNISHDGATASYRAYLETFPELHLSIAMLSNTSQFNIDAVESTVRRIFVRAKTENTLIGAKNPDLPESTLNALAGMYRNERTGYTFQISVKNNGLMLDEDTQLTTVSENKFRTSGFQLEFGDKGGWLLFFLPRDTIRITKVEPAHPAPGDLAAYEGKYFSDETYSSIIVKQKDGILLLYLKPTEGHPAAPTYADGFKLDDIHAALQFIRNPDHSVAALKVNLSRARNMVFKKVE